MEELTTLRKSLSALQVTLAKIESNIQNYLHLPPVDLDAVCLKKQLEILQTTSTSLIDVQEKLINKLDGDEKEPEQEVLDRHHEEYGSKIRKIACKGYYIYMKQQNRGLYQGTNRPTQSIW